MTVTTAPRATDAHELKARHRALWALGDYPTVAETVIPRLGARLVDACPVRNGDRILDLAAGSGNAAIPAALAGAEVVACDLTPQLLESGRRRAEETGVRVDWREADAEELPFADDEFDALVSSVGVMFAPDHQRAADELVRVCRPGARIALANWTPEGFLGQMLAAMRPFAPAPPAGVQPPTLWGRPEHVTALLGDRVTDVETAREHVVVDCFASPEEFRDFFKAWYGPTMAVYRNVSDRPARQAELDDVLVDLARGHWRPDGTMHWEYLLLRARRR